MALGFLLLVEKVVRDFATNHNAQKCKSNLNQIHSKKSDENQQRRVIKKLNMTVNLEKELVFSYPLNRLDKIVSQLKPVS